MAAAEDDEAELEGEPTDFLSVVRGSRISTTDPVRLRYDVNNNIIGSSRLNLNPNPLVDRIADFHIINSNNEYLPILHNITQRLGEFYGDEDRLQVLRSIPSHLLLKFVNFINSFANIPANLDADELHEFFGRTADMELLLLIDHIRREASNWNYLTSFPRQLDSVFRYTGMYEGRFPYLQTPSNHAGEPIIPWHVTNTHNYG
jgi:hypothetical protein